MVKNLCNSIIFLSLFFLAITCQKKDSVEPNQNQITHEKDDSIQLVQYQITVELLDSTGGDTVFWIRYDQAKVTEFYSSRPLFHPRGSSRFKAMHNSFGNLDSIVGNDGSVYRYKRNGNQIVFNSRLGYYSGHGIGPNIDFYLDLDSKNQLQELEWSFWFQYAPGGPGDGIRYYFDDLDDLRMIGGTGNNSWDSIYYLSEITNAPSSGETPVNPFSFIPPEIEFLIAPYGVANGHSIVYNCYGDELIGLAKSAINGFPIPCDIRSTAWWEHLFSYEFDSQGRPIMVEEITYEISCGPNTVSDTIFFPSRHWRITYN